MYMFEFFIYLYVFYIDLGGHKHIREILRSAKVWLNRETKSLLVKNEGECFDINNTSFNQCF